MRHFGRKSLLVNENLLVALRELRADKSTQEGEQVPPSGQFFWPSGSRFDQGLEACARLRPPPRSRCCSWAVRRWLLAIRPISPLSGNAFQAPWRRAARIRPRATTPLWGSPSQASGARAPRPSRTASSRSSTRPRCAPAPAPHSLLDSVTFVSGVSGGSVTAACYGLKKREALDRLPREVPHPQRRGGGSRPASIRSTSCARSAAASTTPGRSRAGSTTTCSRARPSRTSARRRARASGSTPPTSTTARLFIYGEAAFIALCSDLASYRIADAVAASAAVPIVFTPMVHQELSEAVRRSARRNGCSGLCQPELTCRRC